MRYTRIYDANGKSTDTSYHHASGTYGMTRVFEPGANGNEASTILDGACGLECMLTVLRILGFRVEQYNTGKDSKMIIAKRAPIVVREVSNA